MILPASSQEDLAVHFHGALATKLSSGQVCVVGGVDVVMRQGLVHLHVEVQSVQEHRRVLV